MSADRVTEAQADRFKRLAWPMLPVVLRTAQYLVRQSDVAEDLAQETMVKAMRAIDTYQEGTDIKAWLLTILRRTHIDRLRSMRSRPTTMSLDETMVDAEVLDTHAQVGVSDNAWSKPEELMGRFEDQAVIDALHALPDDIRWTLLLVDIEELEQVEAASILGVAVGTIKSRTHRGRAMLRDQLHRIAAKRGWLADQESTS